MTHPVHAMPLDAFRNPGAPVIENTEEEARAMAKRHGSKFASCPCGRLRVLMYYCGEERTEPWARGLYTGGSNGPRSDRLTLHDTPAGIACIYGGKLLTEVPYAAEVKL